MIPERDGNHLGLFLRFPYNKNQKNIDKIYTQANQDIFRKTLQQKFAFSCNFIPIVTEINQNTFWNIMSFFGGMITVIIAFLSLLDTTYYNDESFQKIIWEEEIKKEVDRL